MRTAAAATRDAIKELRTAQQRGPTSTNSVGSWSAFRAPWTPAPTFSPRSKAETQLWMTPRARDGGFEAQPRNKVQALSRRVASEAPLSKATKPATSFAATFSGGAKGTCCAASAARTLSKSCTRASKLRLNSARHLLAARRPRYHLWTHCALLSRFASAARAARSTRARLANSDALALSRRRPPRFTLRFSTALPSNMVLGCL
mmetsp:Transcript_5718/g.16055  ORF Transcript_5718/g.16055 Transcript_5718/m.16055 type:complete len:204 (+) Transcript_5718:809-1420(+)